MCVLYIEKFKMVKKKESNKKSISKETKNFIWLLVRILGKASVYMTILNILDLHIKELSSMNLMFGLVCIIYLFGSLLYSIYFDIKHTEWRDSVE